VRSSDGVLDLELALPRELGGPGGANANPEQLFTAAYATCFQSALLNVAQRRGRKLPDTQVEATVGIGPQGDAFALTVKLVATIPGVPREEALELLREAHRVCPYSNAVRGNIAVGIELAESP
jgi:Ohr subfamily peroxiredoxin